MSLNEINLPDSIICLTCCNEFINSFIHFSGKLKIDPLFSFMAKLQEYFIIFNTIPAGGITKSVCLDLKTANLVCHNIEENREILSQHFPFCMNLIVRKKLYFSTVADMYCFQEACW